MEVRTEGQIRLPLSEGGRVDQTSDPYSMFEEYKEWSPRPLPDPRTASADDILKGLLEIISVEGPMTCGRAFRVYASSAGIQRVGRQIEALFVKALNRGYRRSMLVKRQESTGARRMDVVRAPAAPAVSLRCLGPRSIEDVPPSEIGLLMDVVIRSKKCKDPNVLFREVLNSYGVKRLTAGTKGFLEHVLSQWCSAETIAAMTEECLS